MKTQFIINDKPLTVPSGLHELTWKQFKDLSSVGEDAVKVASILTGIDLTGIDIVTLDLILDLVSWIQDMKIDEKEFKVMNEFKVDEKWCKLPEDLESKTFGQKITATAASAEGLTEAPQILAVYLWDEIKEEPFNEEDLPELTVKVEDLTVMEVIGGAKYVVEKIKETEEKWKQVASSSKVDNDEILAGIENLYKYGDMVTLDEVSGGDVTKYKDIERLPWGLILMKCSYNSEKATFQERLMELKMKK